MSLAFSDIIGFAAGACTTACFIPQVVKTLRSRSTRDISLGMWCLLFLGTTLWLVHGVEIGSVPMMAANGLTLVLVAIILVMKLRYK